MQSADFDFNALAEKIIKEEKSLVEKKLFDSIYFEKDKINLLEGDVVECGVYKGGMSLYLTKLFSNKKIWLVDSYEGFQSIDDGLFKTNKLRDPHDKGYTIRGSCTGIKLEEVKQLFNDYGEGENPNVNYLKGFVKNSLDPKNCPIKKISLLRIDVDAYSATMEVLEFLYPKVVNGGMIIFDDANIDSARFAIEEFFEKNKIFPNIYSVSKQGEILSYLCEAGSYMFKN